MLCSDQKKREPQEKDDSKSRPRKHFVCEVVMCDPGQRERFLKDEDIACDVVGCGLG